MTLAKLNDWMQVMGILAIVASLIFVGLQMRQDQAIAIAGQYQDRYASAMEFFLTREQSPRQVKRMGRRIMGQWGLPKGYGENITAAEFGSDFLYDRTIILIFDNLHYQHEMGLMSETAWKPYEAQLKAIVNGDDQLARYILAHQRDNFRTSFIELCDQLIGANP
jgi:hypothetical protein